MFKNLTLYRIAPDWTAELDAVDEALAKAAFVPCGATQPLSQGWVPPRGLPGAALIESIDGQWLMQLRVEQKPVPGSVLKRRADEVAQKIETETGRKPGKKQMKEIKEKLLLELLPQAFPRQASVNVWIDPAARLLAIDSGSASRAEAVAAQLVESLQGLSLSLLNTAQSPVAGMTDWLVSAEPPAPFTIDRECELQSPDEMKSAVRYARHALDTDDVRGHIEAGKLPTRLALTWNDRVSFVLTESLQLKKLAFLEGVFDGPKPSRDEAFDADAAITTGELRGLLPQLVDALGGEAGLQPVASV